MASARDTSGVMVDIPSAPRAQDIVQLGEGLDSLGD